MSGKCRLCDAERYGGWSLCLAHLTERCDKGSRECELGHCYDSEDLFRELLTGEKALARAEKNIGAHI